MTTRSSTLLLLAALAACSGDGAPSDSDTGALPALTLGGAPDLQIGVLEGDDRYVFQEVVSVRPLASGNLIVSDGGASRLSVYAPDGTFVRRWAGKGEGPGEFRMLSRLYPWPGDSILALDAITGRTSLFDSAGTFARQIPPGSFSSDPHFRMDLWLHGRFWVDGAMDDASRARVRAVLDRLPPPVSSPGYRVVRVATDGALWIREPRVGADGTRTWTLVGDDARPRAAVPVPARFDPQHITPRRILGRWLGESDVHFVRAYGIRETGATVPPPDWLVAAPGPVAGEPVAEQAVRDAIRGSLMALASAQEIHYARNGTYTAAMDSLEWERPEDVEVDVLFADRRGWASVFTHPGFDRICALAYGYTVPPGWTPGEVMCGPAPTPVPQGS